MHDRPHVSAEGVVSRYPEGRLIHAQVRVQTEIADHADVKFVKPGKQIFDSL